MNLPPAMYMQQPWWSEYKGFVDAMSRESMILADSKKNADVLVVHPQTTAWSMYDGKPAENSKNDEIENLCSGKLYKRIAGASTNMASSYDILSSFSNAAEKLITLTPANQMPISNKILQDIKQKAKNNGMKYYQFFAR